MLNPDLDIASLARDFDAHRRLQIPGALTGDAAERIHRCLARKVPWTLAYRSAEGSSKIPNEQLVDMGEPDLTAIRRDVMNRAARDFSFLYDSYMMVSAYKENRDPGLLLHRVLEYFNGAECLDTMRRITGVEAIRKMDAQATRYQPGHFLTRHDDSGEHGHRREVAYVLNLTRRWRADWGGLLQFMDDDGNVLDTFVPRFNTLNLFRVPASHCVSMVVPWAAEPRLAITGWMRSD